MVSSARFSRVDRFALVRSHFVVSGIAAIAACLASSSAIAQSDPILRTTTGSLTTRLFTTSSPVQDVMPQVTQRGVNVDGSLRYAPGQPMAINGNPFGSPWHGSSEGPIDLSTGAWTGTEVDMSLPAPGFRWVISRTFNARQTDSGGSHRNSNGPQGRNWFQGSLPEIKLYTDSGNHANDTLYLIYGAGAFAEYLRHDASSLSYRGTNGAHGVFQKTAAAGGTPELWALNDQRGYTITFLGFDGNAGVAAGQIWKIVDPAGNTAYVGDSSSAATAVSAGYDGSGRVIKAYDSADRRLTYTYGSVGGSTRLTQVKAETKTSGSWSSPSGVATVGTVDYTYYTADGDTYGDQYALKQATVTTPLTDSGVDLTTKTYYRYWEGSYDASTNPGYPHTLKLVVQSEGLRQYDWLDTTFDEDYVAESHDNLKPYASLYFEYDTNYKVSKAWSSGRCGCSGGSGSGTYEYSYATNGSHPAGSGYDEEWLTQVVVKRPDASYCTQYFDEVGQPLSRVVTDIDPSSTPLKWCTYVERDGTTGCVTLIAQPDNVTAYTHSTGTFTTSSSVGLRTGFTRTGSGALTGFETDGRRRTGSSGTAYFTHSRTLSSTSVAVGDTYVIRPYVTADREFPTEQSSETGYNETGYAYTFHTSSLAIKTIVTTLPVVSTGNNGSNSADTFRKFWNLDGTLGFEKDQAGYISYHEYTKGQETKSIQDADTTLTAGGQDFNGVTIPSGFSSSGTPVHWKTTMAYDAQGRLDATTLPSAQVKKHYYSKLADMRSVHLAYNDYEVTPKWYGPVSYTVSNHAGKPTVQATVALSSNESTTALTSHVDETDADPITAMDVGTVAQMTTHVYDSVGTQESESRLYFLIPGSGAGSSGTNYDKTLFGYDDMGRPWRTKTPAGTITRTAFDAIGRVASHWIGTNDYSFSGGESSGPDNMVKTDEVEYDGGSDMANSRVTTSKRFVVDSTSDQRVTTYSYDVRGNLLLQTNPQAPHAFHKYDNLNRRVATGLFSSTGSITVGSDDPTTETANRLALTQTFFDELGRVWKSQRHKIDDSDGSDDDNLQSLTWYDAEGQVVKTDGVQLSKSFYDRLNRQTHQFTLAVDNDSVYADVDDVSGDKVLEERQTTYDPTTGYVIMSARIERHHDDRGASPTLGALDTNGDTDTLKYTAANVKGRIQISAMWYDRFGREEDRVEYGTYGASDFDRDGLSVPSRSDTALRTTSTYNTDGTLKEVTDPRALVTRYEYDATGRKTKDIRNYGDGTPSGTDSDQTVIYAFTNGLMTTLTADVAGTDQVTTYTYGVTKGASAGDSKISNNELLWKVAYPDSVDDSDKVKHAYNAQGQDIWTKDQSGNIVERDYDTGGRETHRRVSTLDSDFDGAVKRISTVYDNLSRVSTVTQYDNATVGSGSVVDQVKYSYDGWSDVTSFEQDRNGTVGGGGDQYTWGQTWAKNTGGRNTLRMSAVSLSSGARTDTWDLIYGTAGGRFDDDTSRVTQVKSGATVLAQYDYNGLGSVVGTDYAEPDVMSMRYSTTPGDYVDLDRFNRPIKSKWTKDLSTDKNFYDIDITWDRNSNITRIEDNVHSGFDALYTIDNLNRLTDAQEGTWNGSSITSETREQEWTLSHTGNWDREKLDLNGDNDWSDSSEHDDTRVHNVVNELSTQDMDTSGGVDRTLTYDEAGNMTYDGVTYTYKWDAFYRLREVHLQSNNALVAEYKYNGLGYRISRHSDTDSDNDVDANDKWFHTAFDNRWRIVGTFRESDSDPKETFVNHQAGLDGQGGSSYIDLVICRNKDANTAWTTASDGTLEERVYYCQNYHADVSALVASGGTMIEWDKYFAYGTPFGLPGGDTDSDGDCDATDVTQIQTWINGSAYDLRGDIDLDGDVDATDKSTVQANFQGITLGRAQLTRVRNRKGSAGYEYLPEIGDKCLIRNRVHASELGRWMSRDPWGYRDTTNSYQYTKSRPINSLDYSGLMTFTHDEHHGCGSYTVKWTTRLASNPCPGDGWIVQYVSVNQGIKGCPTNPPPPQWEYGRSSTTPLTPPGPGGSPVVLIEAFKVLKGSLTPVHDDTWFGNGDAMSRGHVGIFGYNKFYCESDVGNLMDQWGSPSPLTDGPSTDTLPKWFDEDDSAYIAPKDEGLRQMSYNWDCCPFGDPHDKLVATP